MNSMLQIVWDVDPTIFKIGSYELRYYSLMFALAFGQGMILLRWMLKREGEPEKYNDSLFWYITLSTIIGARLGHVLFYDPIYYLHNPVEILNFREGGLASHGATIGIMVALYMFCRKNNKPYLWMLDRAALLVPIAAFFVRLGNLFNSEIYGVVTDKPWGFVFVRAGETLPKHPTQLYEALAYLLLFFVMLWFYKCLDAARRWQGMMIGVFFVYLFTARIIIEQIKEIQVAFEQNMTFNMGQLLSVPFILLGIYLILRALRNEKRDGK